LAENLLRTAAPTHIPLEFWAVPLDSIVDVVTPRSEDPKIIIRVITFELTHAHGTSTSQTDKQTDGRTNGRLTVAIPRNARNASRGKN